jgi:hypothetical protein
MCNLCIMEFYWAIKMIFFKDNCIGLENIMLNEVSLVQKDKGQMFFSHIWKIDPIQIQESHIHINIYRTCF